MELVHKLSDQQTAAIACALYERCSILLKARAGTGKSSTLLAMVLALFKQNPAVQIFIGAYNRAIANEFAGKLLKAEIPWKTANANTMHGAGGSAWAKYLGIESKDMYGRMLDEKKCENLLEEEIESDGAAAESRRLRIEPYRQMILQAVDLAKQQAFGVLCAIDNQAKWYDLIEHFGLDENLPDNADMDFAVRTSIWLYKRSLLCCREIVDFNDLILAPLFYKARVWQYDFVMIDEAQDTNPARRALALKMMKPRGGRLIAVGDEFQAIYGFTGADSDALDIIQKAVSAKVLPLTVTYRCPKSVVEVAKRWVPDIEAAETAPQGVYRTIWLTPKPPSERNLQTACRPCLDKESLDHNDVILCRNTAPIVTLAYQFLRRGTACKVEGRSIGEGLIAIINKWKAVDIDTLLNSVNLWRKREVQEWMAKGKEQKAEHVNDQVDTICELGKKLIEDGKTKVSDLTEFLRSIFGNTPEGTKPKVLTLSTVHKSKGREWKRVFLLGRAKYMPSKWARKDWQMDQERNLMYVAATRAEVELVEVVVEVVVEEER